MKEISGLVIRAESNWTVVELSLGPQQPVVIAVMKFHTVSDYNKEEIQCDMLTT